MATSRASGVTVCSICGEPLNAKGACVACLLRTGLEESSTFDTKSSAPLVFGDFEVARREDGSFWELGRGAFAVTYLAVDNVLRRKVALKVIDVPAAARGSQAVRERFLREARAAAALRHPNVAAVFQFGASPNGSRCFYAMELVEGETLETRVRRDGPLNAKLALQIAIQITRALMAASAQGLIHRDLKPGNIMLTRGDADTEELEVKVIDFGLAKAIADAGGEMDLTHGEFVGTPNFASPEQFESGPVDVRSDIYSLGATLWFALTGKTPFDGRSIEEIRSAQKSNALPVEQLKAARIPPSLRSLLESMLAFEPAARPGIQDLAAQLRRCSALAETETAADVKKEIQLEIAHVLFIDIVGYSKLSINEQHAAVDELTQIVRSTEQFQKAEAADRLIKIPSGDGMALVFYTSPEAPVRCAIQISRGLKDHPRLHIRMGIHSGPVRGVVDVTGRTNLAGAGLNLAQRTMKCGDAGHILLSKHVAEDLSEFEEWRPLLHDLGTCEVKHGVQVAVVNLWSDDVGNRQLPQKFEALRKQRARVRWVEVAAALLLMAGIVAAFFLVSKKSARSPSVVPEKSIAVLPFENLSEDKANSYFADGVQDEILTNLARIADLKVISRISVMHYKSGIARNLREIGQQLGVANVLEGSVQRSGNRVRVNAQLFDARSDRPLWGQTYDRDLADVFAIQSEIAKAIADQLRAKLSPSEKNAIELPPTTDIPAFDLYTRARLLYLIAYMKGGAGNEDLLQAADLLNQAVARDPSFFQAYCQLAFTHDSIYGLGWDHTPARLAQAEAAVQAAARLRPEAGETHLARARNLYFGYLDYDAALAELEIAGRMMPGDSWVPLLKGAIERRRGYWDDSIRDMERAIELDPQNVLTLQQTALSYKCLRRYAEEKSTLARVLAFEPDDAVARVWQAFVELDSKADTYPLHQTIDSIKGANPTAISRFAQAWIFCGLAERDGAAAKNALAAFGENPISFGLAENMIFNRPFAEGIIARMTKDDAKAQAAFTAARAEQEKIIQAQPNYGPALCVLGLIDAGLGRKEQALREGRRAVELLPVGKDAVEGANMLKYLAIIAAWVGEKDLACEQLSSVVRRPSSLSYGQLKLLPFWDPLRGDPRFEKLVEEAKLPVALSASASGARNAANFAPAPEKSIAVLPFENASYEPNTEYLSEGISEALINSLSELQQLRVIARPTAFRYKSKDIDPRQVGRDLGVAAVLTGKVRQMQDALNVQVDLVDAVTGAQIWGAGYDRKITDLVAVKQAIAQEVTVKLKLKLSSDEQRRLVNRDSTNPEAYQFYLRGRYFWNKRTSDGIKQAIEHFQQSIERDPNFALGYVGLADSYIALTFYNFAAPHETMPKAKESAIKALALDKTLAEAHASLGHVLMNYDWNWSAAEKEFKRSIELKPDYATAHEWYAIHYLTATGRLEEAVQEMKKALELEPASLVMNTFMGATLYYAGRYDEAIDQCRRTIQMDPNFAVAHWHLGLAYEEKQVLDAATEEFKKAISLSGDSPLMRAALGRAYAESQKTHEANEVLDELNELAKRQYASAYELATIYVALGDNEQAFQSLEKAYAEHSFHLVNLNVSPQFKSVRSDPRFQDLVQRLGLSKSASDPVAAEKSIAVLPFEYLSNDKANAYFAEGIQDEILTRLSKIADLKVISRTSTQHYKGAPENLPEIAKQLGVAHILEGRVQKRGDAVRVNVQLIKAANDSHLWADTFDRKLTDIFSVESEVAKAIADQLRAKLTGEEEQVIAVKPTNNPEAYDSYLRGLAFEARGFFDFDLQMKATGFYQRAVQLDPNFALAWARLSRADALLSFELVDDSAARRDAAKKALVNAQKLQPNSPETLLALGYYQYWGLRDYGLAKTTLKEVGKLLPGNSEVLGTLGLIARREGNWDESITYFEQALVLDPRNVELLNNAADTYGMLRQFPTALKLYERALDIVPNNPELMAFKAVIYQAQGNLEGAAKALSEVNAQTPSMIAFIAKINQLRLERNFGEGLRLLQARLEGLEVHSDSAFEQRQRPFTQLLLANMQRLAGDAAEAKTNAEQARKTLEQLYKNERDNSLFAAGLSSANAELGDKNSALKEAERAIMLSPSSKDRVGGPGLEENLALIQTTVGENGRAISTLTRLLQISYGGWVYGPTPVTPALLQLDPFWDPLRGDPRFEQIVASLTPKGH